MATAESKNAAGSVSARGACAAGPSLRAIRTMTDRVFADLSPRFTKSFAQLVGAHIQRT